MRTRSIWYPAVLAAFFLVPISTAVGQEIIAPRLSERLAAAAQYGIDESLMHDGKCGFRWMAQLAERARMLPADEAFRLQQLLKPAEAMAETIIGQFRITYDTAGTNAPALLDGTGARIPGTARAFVDSVGRIFNDVWNEEVGQLGYDPPPLPSGYYSVVILELSGSYYGQTVFQLPQLNPGESPPRYASYIEIDNDFREYSSKGIAGLQVTAAHEFHHAIQVGAYGFWSGDVYAHELTSTWMEDHVYPFINDYLQYLPDFYGSTGVLGMSGGRSFVTSSLSGYERCVWGQFLSKRYGATTMTAVWERMKTVPFLQASDEALRERGTNFETAFANFSYWNYFTAHRADAFRSYQDGLYYPRYRRIQTVPFNGSLAQAVANVEPLSAVMIDFVLSNDTLTTIVINTEVDRALEKDFSLGRVEAILSATAPSVPYQTLANGLRVGLVASDLTDWRTFYLESSTSSDVPRMQAHPFPNPLRLATDDGLALPVEADVLDVAEVLFMTSSGDRAHVGKYSVISTQGETYAFIPSGELKARVASGVYTVVATVRGRVSQWTVAIIP